jgi:hypothetical protein
MKMQSTIFIALYYFVGCGQGSNYRNEDNLEKYCVEVLDINLNARENNSLFIILQPNICISCVDEDLEIINMISKKEKPIIIMEENIAIYNRIKNIACKLIIDSTHSINKYGLMSGYIELVKYNDGNIEFYDRLDEVGKQRIKDKYGL